MQQVWPTEAHRHKLDAVAAQKHDISTVFRIWLSPDQIAQI